MATSACGQTVCRPSPTRSASAQVGDGGVVVVDGVYAGSSDGSSLH